MIRFIGLCILCLMFTKASAQEVYKAEIGINAGGAYYLGDANNQLFKNMQPAFGGFFRYKFNPRLALKVELLSTSIKGDFVADNILYKLNKSVNSADIVGEFNFFDFEKNKNNRFSKTFSPYIFAGIGGMTGMYTGQKIPILGIPFGVGMKLKLADRWNLHAQWSNKLLLADNLEQNTDPTLSTALNNPGNLNGSNIFNNDLLSTVTIGISFDFWETKCDCKSGVSKNGNYKKRHK
ncbi:MAG: DUF6089 family protein [Paludibacter sp.]